MSVALLASLPVLHLLRILCPSLLLKVRGEPTLGVSHFMDESLPAAGMTQDYEGTPLDAAMGFFDSFAGNQPGDPVKAVQRILDVIQLQGLGQGKGKTCYACRLALTAFRVCWPRWTS